MFSSYTPIYVAEFEAVYVYGGKVGSSEGEECIAIEWGRVCKCSVQDDVHV